MASNNYAVAAEPFELNRMRVLLTDERWPDLPTVEELGVRVSMEKVQAILYCARSICAIDFGNGHHGLGVVISRHEAYCMILHDGSGLTVLD